MQDLEAKANEQRRNSDAESACVRRTLWGETGDGVAKESDDMATTVLGDITHPAPIIMPQQNNSALPAIALLVSSIFPLAGAGAVAGYLLAGKSQPANNQTFDDDTVKIGLGRIEDYINVGDKTEPF